MSVPLSELDAPSRVIKRAQYEAFEFTIEDDGVRVRNGSHANPEDHEYLVTVEGNTPATCECPADANYEGACKHRVAVAIRRPILDAAINRQLAADGGKPIATSETSPAKQESLTSVSDHQSTEAHEVDEDTTPEHECVCGGLPDGLPCWECVRTGRRAVPSTRNTEQKTINKQSK